MKVINEHLADYGIANATNVIQLPRTTSGNDSYIVTVGDTEQYVLRLLVRQTALGAENERRLQIALLKADITCPLYLLTLTNGVVSTKDGVSVVVSKCIAGSRQPDDTLKLAGSMGSMLARIHDSLHGVEITPNEQQWFRLDNAMKQLDVYDGHDKELIEEKTIEYSSIFNMNLPRALTHGDFHTNNVFSANDKVVAVFDFESAEYTVRILDIARLYLTYRKVTNLNPSLILDEIVQKYSDTAVQPLLPIEIEQFNNAFIYVALVSSVSIYNHGNISSSEKYIEIAKHLMR